MINDGNEMADSCLTHHTLTQAFSQHRYQSLIKTYTVIDKNTTFPMDTLIYWFMYSYMTNKTTVLTS